MRGCDPKWRKVTEEDKIWKDSDIISLHQIEGGGIFRLLNSVLKETVKATQHDHEVRLWINL